MPRLMGVAPSVARNFAARTALPQPPKVSQKVPKNSASEFVFHVFGMVVFGVVGFYFFRYLIFVVPMVPLKANGAWSK